MELPQEFTDRMKKRLGKEFPAFSATYETPPVKGIRVNTLKISPAEFARRAPFPLGEEVGGDPACRYIAEEKAGADVYHFAGLYYVQEPSAMTVGQAAAPLKKERVLDLCAAPGGKTTHLALLMAGEEILVANEIDYKRALILKENVDRMGIKNCAVMHGDPAFAAACFPEYFDLVLVDAPCSGEGMFKKEPNAVPEWSLKNVARCAARQTKILDEAAKTVAGGGHLIYSTCTFAEEEDEEQIEGFLKRHGEFTLVSEKKLLPHLFRGEGHFCAVLRREEGGRTDLKPYPARRDGNAERAFRAFAEETFGRTFPEKTDTGADGRVYLVPDALPAAGAVIRPGVEAGRWDGKNFKPAHALAMAHGRDAKRKLSLSREEAKKYLRGETLDADLPDGWCVVCVEEFPLGWGKCVRGTVKNHLPASLRMYSRT